MAKLWAHVTDPPPLPRTQRPELVRAFDDVVARATAKDPDDRYATAGEMAGRGRRRAIALQDAQVAGRARRAGAARSPPAARRSVTRSVFPDAAAAPAGRRGRPRAPSGRPAPEPPAPDRRARRPRGPRSPPDPAAAARRRGRPALPPPRRRRRRRRPPAALLRPARHQRLIAGSSPSAASPSWPSCSASGGTATPRPTARPRGPARAAGEPAHGEAGARPDQPRHRRRRRAPCASTARS